MSGLAPLEKTLLAWDELVRVGRGSEVARDLGEWKKGRPPRPLWQKFANIAWRVGLPLWGARLLATAVRPKGRKGGEKATPEEIAEYAACLIKLGIWEEGLSLLGQVDKKQCPQVYLYEALARFRAWQFENAVTPLSQYVALMPADSYPQLVGKINLASAMVSLRKHREVSSLLEELCRRTQERGLQLLFANALEIQATNFILQGKYRQGEKSLSAAEGLLSDTSDVYAFLIKKWKVSLFFLEAPDAPAHRKSMMALSQEALARKNWELHRDCERILAIHAQDEPKLWRLYFGTPYESFRRTLAREAEMAPPPISYAHHLGPKGGSPPRINIETASVVKGRPILKVGQAMHRLLQAMASDFYRPFRLEELFSKVYAKEIFFPNSSPAKVYRVILRLRERLARAKVPLGIVENDGWYSLQSERGCQLIVTEGGYADRRSLQLSSLRRRWEGKPFSVQEAAAVLEMPPRSVVRMLARAVEDGELVRVGVRRGTRYHFTAA